MSTLESFVIETGGSAQNKAPSGTVYRKYKADRDLTIVSLLLDATSTQFPNSGYGNSQTFQMRLYTATGTLIDASPTVLGPTAGGLGIVEFPLTIPRLLPAATDFIVAVYLTSSNEYMFQAPERAVGTVVTSTSGVRVTLDSVPQQNGADSIVPATDGTLAGPPAVGIKYLLTGDSVGILLG